MKCLIIMAHPLKNSLCKQLGHHVETILTRHGHKTAVEDLYADNFNPVLSVAERESYYAEQYDISGVSEQAERLVASEALVLVFPTWWFGFPAMLKGWFDRVWSPGIAYDHANDFGPIIPRLDKLKYVLLITTLGAPWWVDFL